ncbi:MAG: hypothetical protein DMG30_06220 [Acidobacteria bacterium]|nr:MAG: hypothetical protein DMG30_06220 [Acidobacteriota bacterium]
MIFWSRFWSAKSEEEAARVGVERPFPLVFQALPSRRRKRDMPEAWRGCGEFYWDEITLRIFKGRARHPATLLLRGTVIDQVEFCLQGEVPRAKQHRAVVIDGRSTGG